MAFTIMQGTIWKSLTAFDIELNHCAKQHKFAKEQNGVVVVTVDGHAITYHKTEPGKGKPGETCPISRTVIVTAREDGTLDIKFQEGEELPHAGYIVKYPFISGANEQILNFLIHNITPPTARF